MPGPLFKPQRFLPKLPTYQSNPHSVTPAPRHDTLALPPRCVIDRSRGTQTTSFMSQNSNAEAEISALLAELWQRHLPSTRERLDVLERAAHAASVNGLDEPERAEAQAVAHKLSGNLGMFGYPQAGSLAGEIEEILKAPALETLPRLSPLVQKLRETLKGKL